MAFHIILKLLYPSTSMLHSLEAIVIADPDVCTWTEGGYISFGGCCKSLKTCLADHISRKRFRQICNGINWFSRINRRVYQRVGHYIRKIKILLKPTYCGLISI